MPLPARAQLRKRDLAAHAVEAVDHLLASIDAGQTLTAGDLRPLAELLTLLELRLTPGVDRQRHLDDRAVVAEIQARRRAQSAEVATALASAEAQVPSRPARAPQRLARPVAPDPEGAADRAAAEQDRRDARAQEALAHVTAELAAASIDVATREAVAPASPPPAAPTPPNSVPTPVAVTAPAPVVKPRRRRRTKAELAADADRERHAAQAAAQSALAQRVAGELDAILEAEAQSTDWGAVKW